MISVCLPSCGMRKMAFSILPLSLRAGMTTVVLYFCFHSASLDAAKGLAKVKWFKQKNLKMGSLANMVLNKGAMSGMLYGNNIRFELR